ncbi:MAG: DUF4126 family protein [Clostridia bacterium]|nr:DUF4126 family protein [Deltaproteobacteria bacterium]
MVHALALAIGIIAGLRAMTAPAAVSWGARLGWLDVTGTWFAFLGTAVTSWVFTVLAIGELIGDQLPKTPSRKAPIQFCTRIVMGVLSGGAIGAGHGVLAAGAVLGGIGAVIGTFGGSAVRSKLAVIFGKDMLAAFIEDAVAIFGAFLIMWTFRPRG